MDDIVASLALHAVLEPVLKEVTKTMYKISYLILALEYSPSSVLV